MSHECFRRHAKNRAGPRCQIAWAEARAFAVRATHRQQTSTRRQGKHLASDPFLSRLQLGGLHTKQRHQKPARIAIYCFALNAADAAQTLQPALLSFRHDLADTHSSSTLTLRSDTGKETRPRRFETPISSRRQDHGPALRARRRLRLAAAQAHLSSVGGDGRPFCGSCRGLRYSFQYPRGL